MAMYTSTTFISYFFLFLIFLQLYVYTVKLSTTPGLALHSPNTSSIVAAPAPTPGSSLVFIQLVSIYIFYINGILQTPIFIAYAISSLLLLSVNFLFYKQTTTSLYDYVVPASVPTLLLFFSQSTTYLEFLVYIELLGYTFYFQFITTSATRGSNKLIDLFLFYYWGSFLGTIFLFLTAYRLLVVYNTSHFTELAFFSSHGDLWVTLLMITGIFLKIGASGVHFLKADLYKYISPITILNFSLLSAFTYLYVYMYFKALTPLVYLFDILFSVFFLFGFLVLALNIKHLSNLSLFFGYSAVFTTTMCIFVLF